MLGEQKLKEFTEQTYQKTLIKINDHIYHFFLDMDIVMLLQL